MRHPLAKSVSPGATPNFWLISPFHCCCLLCPALTDLVLLLWAVCRPVLCSGEFDSPTMQYSNGNGRAFHTIFSTDISTPLNYLLCLGSQARKHSNSTEIRSLHGSSARQAVAPACTSFVSRLVAGQFCTLDFSDNSRLAKHANSLTARSGKNTTNITQTSTSFRLPIIVKFAIKNLCDDTSFQYRWHSAVFHSFERCK